MVSLVYELDQLNAALGGLEDAVTVLEGRFAAGEGAQPDMFPETKAAVVQSLDTMITHVETMLEKA